MKKPMTMGLTHIALRVKNVKRSVRFYQKVFDTKVMYDMDGFVQVQTPGSKDIIVFEQSDSAQAGRSGGIVHFGFRLHDPKDIDAMARRIRSAGGKIKEKGEFMPGEPYLFFNDPDGYEVEVWYEIKPKRT